VRRFRRAGFIVEKNAGHWKVFAADRVGGVLLGFGSTPSDRHWERPMKRRVRQLGLDLTPRRPDNRQLELVARNGGTDVAKHGGGIPTADAGRTANARLRLRDAVDEINSRLPGHRGAIAHIVRELIRYADAHGMQRWPNQRAGAQMILAMYRPGDSKFAVWGVALVDAGLDSVGMPDDNGRDPGLDDAIAAIVTDDPPSLESPLARELPEWPGPSVVHTVRVRPPAPVDAIEVLYRLTKGGMDSETAYAVAREWDSLKRLQGKG